MQFYPQPGWVEEDANEIWEASQFVILDSLKKYDINPKNIIAIGICNQRESTLIWDKKTQEPLSKLIVWQDRRTSNRCDELKNLGLENKIKNKTGLTIDPYFSATKLEWLIKNFNDNYYYKKNEKNRVNNKNNAIIINNTNSINIKNSINNNKSFSKNIAFGTLDSWILFKLSGNHMTDASNASRTMLFNIFEDKWDNELLDIFNIPENILPQVMPTFGNAIFGFTKKDSVFGHKIPICCIFGDQQSALFGQKCFKKGDIKSTYGTGSFIMVNNGFNKNTSNNNLISTIFYKSFKNEIFYGIEGSIYNAGSIFQWLKDGLGIIKSFDEIEKLAFDINYQSNLYFVPAFTGLGAPYWDPYARAILIGIMRSTNKKEIVRACIESIAYRTRDVMIAMAKDCNHEFEQLKIDGGVSQNNLFCQILADLTGVKIIKNNLKEITALGSFFGAGIGIGLWKTAYDIEEKNIQEEYTSKITDNERTKLYLKWLDAVSRSRNWAI